MLVPILCSPNLRGEAAACRGVGTALLEARGLWHTSRIWCSFGSANAYRWGGWRRELLLSWHLLQQHLQSPPAAPVSAVSSAAAPDLRWPWFSKALAPPSSHVSFMAPWKPSGIWWLLFQSMCIGGGMGSCALAVQAASGSYCSQVSPSSCSHPIPTPQLCCPYATPVFIETKNRVCGRE